MKEHYKESLVSEMGKFARIKVKKHMRVSMEDNDILKDYVKSITSRLQ